MIRASLAWLLLGVMVGALMLTDRAVAGSWRLWMAPTHGHVLFVGWFVQFAVGVAYWLLPRRRSAARPLGYRKGMALIAALGVNVGMVLRATAEPAERAGHTGRWIDGALAASAILQVTAVSIFVVQLWPRVGPRPDRPRPTERRSSPASAGTASTSTGGYR